MDDYLTRSSPIICSTPFHMLAVALVLASLPLSLSVGDEKASSWRTVNPVYIPVQTTLCSVIKYCPHLRPPGGENITRNRGAEMDDGGALHKSCLFNGRRG